MLKEVRANKFLRFFELFAAGWAYSGNDIKRVTARLSVDQEITSKLYASLSVNGGYSVTNTPNGTTYSPTDLIYQLNPYETKDVNAELVSFPGRTYADLFNQYSEKTSDKEQAFPVVLIIPVLKVGDCNRSSRS